MQLYIVFFVHWILSLQHDRRSRRSVHCRPLAAIKEHKQFGLHVSNTGSHWDSQSFVSYEGSSWTEIQPLICFQVWLTGTTFSAETQEQVRKKKQNITSSSLDTGNIRSSGWGRSFRTRLGPINGTLTQQNYTMFKIHNAHVLRDALKTQIADCCTMIKSHYCCTLLCDSPQYRNSGAKQREELLGGY